MKDRLVLTLGEDLTEEKEWQWEGIAVLTAHLLLPQTAPLEISPQRYFPPRQAGELPEGEGLGAALPVFSTVSS